MIEILKGLEPFVPFGIGLLVIAALLIVRRATKDIEISLPFGGSIKSKGRPGGPDPTSTVRAVRIDLEQYGEVVAALGALIEALPDEVEAAARQWFSQLATRLATRLTEQRDHHYRVAIWLDDPGYSDKFVGIGRGLFDPSDADMDFLERKYTIGGLAFESPTMTYYCRDRVTDANFKPRKRVPPSFESVFGLALGPEHDRWGVMTVDARQKNGFPDEAQWLIRRFGELASVGAVVWYARVTTTGPTEATTS